MKRRILSLLLVLCLLGSLLTPVFPTTFGKGAMVDLAEADRQSTCDMHYFTYTTNGEEEHTATCAQCGTVAVLAHNYILTGSVDAQCQYTGLRFYNCPECGQAKTVVTPAPGHDFDKGTVTKAPTCAEEGIRTYTCYECRATETEAIPALGHSYILASSVDAQCLYEGHRFYCCPVCGHSKTEITPALGHDFDSGTVTKAPTCAEEGIRTYTCYECRATETEAIPTVGHSYSLYNNMGSYHCVKCSYCPATYSEMHSNSAGTCVCGATAPAIDSTVSIGHTLDLASDISINFAVWEGFLANYDSFYMECLVPIYEGNELIGTRVITLEPELRSGFYYFVLSGMTSLEMNNTVEAQLHMVKDGSEFVSNVDRYSIATYAYSKLDNPSYPDALKVVCTNLLQYGAKAQLWKGYRTDALADSALTEAHRIYLTDVETVSFGDNRRDLTDIENPTISMVGKTLMLDNKIIVRYVINTSNYAGSPEDLSLRITYVGADEEEKTVTITDIQVYYEPSHYYVFDFDGLLASELRTVMRVAVYDGDTQVSVSTEYSVDSYGNGKTGALLALAQAMIAYSDSAKAFFS